MNRYPVRADRIYFDENKPPRIFDILIDDDGDAKIETLRDKVKYCISLKEAFRQAGKNIEYVIRD